MNIQKLILACILVSLSFIINDATGIIENNSSTLNAAPWMPCEPDCPDDKFEDGGLHTYTFFLGGCEYKVDFYYRYACDTWCDFNIYRIQLKDSTCINTYSVDFLMDYATRQVILYSGFGTDCMPDSVGCSTYFRVNNAGCMTRTTPTPYYLPETGEVPSYFSWQTIFPCEGSVCCFRYFKVCRDIYDNLSVVPHSVSSAGTCPQTDPTGGTCYDTCQ